MTPKVIALLPVKSKRTQLSGKHASLPHPVSADMVRYSQKVHCSLHKNPQWILWTGKRRPPLGQKPVQGGVELNPTTWSHTKTKLLIWGMMIMTASLVKHSWVSSTFFNFSELLRKSIRFERQGLKFPDIVSCSEAYGYRGAMWANYCKTHGDLRLFDPLV